MSTLFTSDAELERCQTLLRQFEAGTVDLCVFRTVIFKQHVWRGKTSSLNSTLLYQNVWSQLPEGTTDEMLWEAKKIVDAIIHPATGEPMFLPGRMSAFVPMNVPIAMVKK